jgi:multidrug efflux system membrane fusion protein
MSAESEAPSEHPGQAHRPAEPHAGHSHSRHRHHRHHRPGAADGSQRVFYRRRSFWLLGVPLAVVVLLIGGCFLFRPAAKAKGPPGGAAIAVSAAPVRTGSIDIILNALGTVTPVYTVTVTSRVAGEVTQVLYQEGQMVKKGDLLLVIDPRPFVAAVTQAEGQLKRDEALLENAQLDVARYQDAVKTHAIPEQQLATQQALVLEDQGTVELDQGNLEAAKVNLDYTQIRSPIDGQVGLRPVDPGNIVAAGGTTPLVVITQLQPITVIFTVAEDSLGEILPELHSGRPLRVDALDRAQQTQLAQGFLNTLDNQVNLATGTVRARATFANAKDELFPNQFVNARLYVKTLTQVNLVPTAAIQRNDTAAFVYVIQPDGTARSQPVTLTASEGDEAAVTGVMPGDSLVTDGFEKLEDGSKVTVRQPGAPTPKAGGS